MIRCPDGVTLGGTRRGWPPASACACETRASALTFKSTEEPGEKNFSV